MNCMQHHHQLYDNILCIHLADRVRCTVSNMGSHVDRDMAWVCIFIDRPNLH